MNRKWLLRIILVLTLISLLIIVLYNKSTRYNNYVISIDKWDKIISKRTYNNSISLNSIKFDDYNLSIDKNNNILYYSINYINEKYNPTVEYISNSKLKIVFNKKITDNDIKILVYNDECYNIYSLVLTKMPILNIKFNETKDEIKRVSVSTTFYDNRQEASQKVIKSDGKLTLLENNIDYFLSLKLDSLGHNERDNNISLFGMDKHDEYVLKKSSVESKNSVLLFINDEYKGNYTIGHRERKINNEPKQKNR